MGLKYISVNHPTIILYFVTQNPEYADCPIVMPGNGESNRKDGIPCPPDDILYGGYGLSWPAFGSEAGFDTDENLCKIIIEFYQEEVE
jgi:hypothetical protein